MRPLKLTMVAFGPYRDREVIDFTVMHTVPLFVISGATGSGKTTIFDAICFALYGQASGEDRSDSRLLRSQFADDDTYTAVELEFLVGNEQYQVVRQMKHRRAGNKSETGDKQELYKWHEDSEQYVPAVDRFMATEVNVKLYEIIGLTREQFNQIVMLPQGEFRKLLTSDTDNKEEILRKLFQTQLYERLELAFYDRHRSMQQQLKEKKQQLSVLLDQTKETLPVREGNTVHLLLEEEVRNEQLILQALQEEVAYYEQQKSYTASKKQHIANTLQQEQLKLQQAQLFNEKYDQWIIKLEQRQHLEQQQVKMSAMKNKLILADKAQRIIPYEQHWLQQQTLTANITKQLAEYEERVATTTQLALEAEQHYASLLQLEPQRKEEEKQLDVLQQFLPIVKNLTSQKKSLHRLEQEITNHEQWIVRLVKQEGEQRREKERLREERFASDQAATNHGAVVQLQAVIEQLGKQLGKVVDMTQQLTATKQAEQKLQQQAQVARTTYEDMEYSWRTGQAGLLAAQLVEGDGCPVCGSKDHPQPAAHYSSLPNQSELQQTQQVWLELERQAQTESAKRDALEHRFHEQYEELVLLKQDYMTAIKPLVLLYERDNESVSEEMSSTVWQRIVSQLDERSSVILTDQFWHMIDNREQVFELDDYRSYLRILWKRIAEQREMLEAIMKDREVREQREMKCDQELGKLQTEREVKQQQLQQLQIEKVSIETILKQELARIPESLQTLAQLEAHIADKTAMVHRMQQQWQQSEQRKQQMETKLVEVKANVEQMKARYNDTVISLEQSYAQLLEQLEKASFESLEYYQQCKMNEEDMANSSAEVEEYEASTISLREQIAVLAAELQGKEKQDIASLQQEVLLAQQQYDDIMAEEQQAILYEKEARRMVHSLLAIMESEQQTELALMELADVYTVLKGDNRLKISFERYILIEYLEQILYAANERLKYMSDGQFMLQRSERLEWRGKQSGLGLDVYDAYTGSHRDVRSLSGGEKFNASLCLALGMTDVIQANQGGITIEMMFIDEGFGSLDEEALQKALTVLVDLQKAGRMIGVISHVEEVKQAFPVCIEVTKLKEGYSKTELIMK